MSGGLQIAKNATFLYVNLLVNMFVGIFTVRVMLEALGVEDYGLYTVAWTALGMFNIVVEGLNTCAGRFITSELGSGDVKRTNDTFCTAMVAFIAIFGVILILAETIGVWYVRTQLVVPEGRETAAMAVFQLSVLSSLFTTTQSPYAACMYAHEKFNISTILSLVGTFAKLGILLIIREMGGDHLIIFTASLVGVSILSMLYSRIYCIRHFPEARFRWHFDWELFRPMLRFSVWEVFGTISRTLKSSGFQLTVNMFFGVVANAAIGIGLTVSGAVTGLANTLTGAFGPRMTKQYGARDMEGVQSTMTASTLLSMILYGMIAMPLLVELDYVMHLWLDEVPLLAYQLSQAQLVINMLIMAYLVTSNALKAMARNKGLNLVQVCDGFLSLAACVLAARLGFSAYVAVVIFNLGLLWNLGWTLWLISRATSGAFVRRYISRAVVNVLFTEAVILAILFSVHHLMGEGFITMITVSLLSVVLFGAASWLWLLPAQQKESLRLFVKSKLSRPVKA